MKTPDDKEIFFKVRLRISDLVITENFINSAAQFLLEEACGCARFLFRFHDD